MIYNLPNHVTPDKMMMREMFHDMLGMMQVFLTYNGDV